MKVPFETLGVSNGTFMTFARRLIRSEVLTVDAWVGSLSR
ncbi:hypothetical protein BC739_008127 [Kutzneria viridogrisea]|uniref:Uncharacterized protein n=2 Tax=Kutzneria TaxID=43356 RepID=W5W9K3_9PSEU|nr:hypothetical protein KALB_3842 [Kutzneria albida DSM 43870]MBA8930880.1 hypothetical protein [Kutzneria viridogrisea]